MKIDCEVIRDLMPLYVDGTASEKSRAAVDEHIAECALCREMLEEMRQEVPAELMGRQSDELVQKLRWRRRLRVLALVLVGIVLSMAGAKLAWEGWCYYCNDFAVLSEESDYLIELAHKEDGQVYIYPTRLNLRGHVLNEWRDEDNGDLYLWSTSTRWNRKTQPVWSVTWGSNLYYDPEIGYARREWVGPEGPDHRYEMVLLNRIYKGPPDWFLKGQPHERELLYERTEAPDEEVVALWFERILDEWQE